jgi:hypothetical protein
VPYVVAMEFIIAVSITSQVAIALIDRLSQQAENSQVGPIASDSTENSQSSEPQAPGPSARIQPSNLRDERLAELKRHLAQLRAQARSLNSPDTFVQYARVTREATMLETQIESLEGRRVCSRPYGFPGKGYCGVAHCTKIVFGQ